MGLFYVCVCVCVCVCVINKHCYKHVYLSVSKPALAVYQLMFFMMQSGDCRLLTSVVSFCLCVQAESYWISISLSAKWRQQY